MGTKCGYNYDLSDVDRCGDMDTKELAISLDEAHVKPELLRSDPLSITIDLDSIFTKDVTSSGSFDLRSLRNLTFGKILESIPIPILLIDSNQLIIYANESVHKIGGEMIELVGKSFAGIFSGLSETQRAVQILDQILKDRKTLAFESLISINGKNSYCRMNFRSVRVAKQRCVLCLVEDLSASKRQLIMTEKYHQLVQVFPIGIAEFVVSKPVSGDAVLMDMLDAVFSSRLVGANLQFAKILGWPSVDQIKGMRLGKLLPIGPKNKEIYEDWIIKKFPIRSIETREELESGRQFFENTLVANFKRDHFFGFWLMRQNITERKQIERDLRNARDKLEEKVRERTDELITINEKLTAEIEERQKAEKLLADSVIELKEVIKQVKTLSGLLPICASCKKIRDDQGYWTQVEVYVSKHSDADFTHSICPECAMELYPDFYKAKSSPPV